LDTSILDCKRAVEGLLASTNPTIQIAYENSRFVPPEVLYIQTQFMIQRPDDPVFTAGYHRERMQFQVFVVDTIDTGTGEAYTKALSIRETFYKGLHLKEGPTDIYVLRTPFISHATVATDKVVVSVVIDLVVEVSSF